MDWWQTIAIVQRLCRWFAIIYFGQGWRRTCKSLLTIVLLVLFLTSCGEPKNSPLLGKNGDGKPALSQNFAEIAPPEVLLRLSESLDNYLPQVKIITPYEDVVLEDTNVSVSLQVENLPIYQDAESGLGSHLQVILDNQRAIAVYDTHQPLILSDLSPGTHTLRVFVVRPWGESFKNAGAYAQTTFHIYTKTEDNKPDPEVPLLTYNLPSGEYGAEPILLDFYLTNAPLRVSRQGETEENPFSDWRIRCTINGESFVLDRWQAIYLKGFHQGMNWVKLEFLDNQGNPVKNVFNSTVQLVNYQPSGKDTLSRIVRGELPLEQVRGIVDPSYRVIPKPEVTPGESLPQESEEVPVTESDEVESTTPSSESEELEKIPVPEEGEVPKVEPQESETPKTPSPQPQELEKIPVPEEGEVPKVDDIPQESETVPTEPQESETLKTPSPQPQELEKIPVNETELKEVPPSPAKPTETPTIEPTPESSTKETVKSDWQSRYGKYAKYGKYFQRRTEKMKSK